MRLVGSEGLHVFHERTSDVTKDVIQIQAWGMGKEEWRSCGVRQRSCVEHGTKIFRNHLCRTSSSFGTIQSGGQD